MFLKSIQAEEIPPNCEVECECVAMRSSGSTLRRRLSILAVQVRQGREQPHRMRIGKRTSRCWRNLKAGSTSWDCFFPSYRRSIGCPSLLRRFWIEGPGIDGPARAAVPTGHAFENETGSCSHSHCGHQEQAPPLAALLDCDRSSRSRDDDGGAFLLTSLS